MVALGSGLAMEVRSNIHPMARSTQVLSRCKHTKILKISEISNICISNGEPISCKLGDTLCPRLVAEVRPREREIPPVRSLRA